MAKVVVYFRFADGDMVQAIVTGKTSYPDALSQMRHEAVEAFKESMAYAMALQAPIPKVEDET